MKACKQAIPCTLFVISTTLLSLAAGPASGGTLKEVRDRGVLRCGLGTNPGFTSIGEDGTLTGLDVDICRAIAAATLGDADRIEPVFVTSKERFSVLQSGDIDVLTRASTWTFARDSGLRIDFAGVTYYTGHSFLLRDELGIDTVEELDGAAICVPTGTTNELTISEYFADNGLTYRMVRSDDASTAAEDYADGRCDALSNDHAILAGYRSRLPHPQAHVILPQLLTKEPLGVAVRQDDPEWFDIVKWVLFALVQAEESGITSQNVEAKAGLDDAKVDRLLGQSTDLGRLLGLQSDWAYQAVRQVGNYGEIYERNFGAQSPLKLERGLNALWQDGGLMYAMPIR